MIDWSVIDNKIIMITGATGLIGKTFIEYILNRNKYLDTHTKIIAVGRDKNKFNSRFKNVNLSEDVEFIEQNVNEDISYGGRIDYIIHLASNTHPRLYASDPINTILTNIIGTNNLLKLASTKKDCVFFFMSSTDVYGENVNNKKFINEKDFGYVDSNTLRAGYIEGKRAGESLCNAYYEKEGVNYFIGRLCRTFGKNMQLDDSRAVSQFIMKAAKGEDVILKSSGNQLFSYLRAEDVVTAILCILSKGMYTEAYNISDNSQIMVLKELASTIAEIGKVKVIFGDADAIEKKGASNYNNVCLDSTKLSNLGWSPSCSLREGLEETVTFVRKTFYKSR